jgi:hypothetical protein
MSMEDAIRATLYRDALGVDTGDAALVAGCYTEDAETSGPGGAFTGRDAIHADVEAKRESRAARGIVRHVVTNVLVDDADAGEVRVRSLWVATVHTGGETRIFATGSYEDAFVDDNGTWRIKRRVTHLDGR